jgi:hypothetical protein
MLVEEKFDIPALGGVDVSVQLLVISYDLAFSV